jgi:nucleoside phosphorylase
MSTGQIRNPLHVIIDLLYLYYRAYEQVHKARTEQTWREALAEWNRCHPLVWGSKASRNDTIRTLADPAKAWLTVTNSRFVSGHDLNLVEECVHALSVFAINSTPMALPDIYSKKYDTEEELWQRWTKQSHRIDDLSSLIARLRELAGRAGEAWTPAVTAECGTTTAADEKQSSGDERPPECHTMPLVDTQAAAASCSARDDIKAGEMSKDTAREYLMKVGALKGMLNDRARGGYPSDADYSKLRAELVNIPAIRDVLPTFVLTCHTVQEFWIFIKSKFSTYNERTVFLQQEFTPILSWLEGGAAPAKFRPVPIPPPKPDLVVVTVNDHETRAVLDAFEAATRKEVTSVSLDDRVYHDLGRLNGTSVFHAISEQGSGGARGMQQTVEKAIRLLDPGSIIAAGIAFGIDEKTQAIGDVLLSKQLRLYELQRVGKNKIMLRGSKPDASTRLTSHFVGFAQTKWKGPTFRAGVILTGEKLIDNVDYRSQLQAFESEAIGGEMEGAGLNVASSDQKVDWIVLKAICDFADGNKATDKEERQKIAAGNAARFLVEALKYAPLTRR